MSDSHEPNRLSHETSPYLLQHAYNPVDWYAWGPEAFAAARERDLPIFLSVGYSACHWCHVMERESFENPQIAAQMNQGFINVKVDREERPDIDQIYMSAVQLVTGQGGWPMSVFLTPEGQPFYGGTYWPPVSRQGMLGFNTVLARIQEYWTQNREECLTKGAELVEAIDEMHHREQTRCPLNEDLLRHAQHRLLQSADFQEGGFGHAPKFPHPVDLRVLLRTWKRFQEPQAMEAVTLTLNKMADGGIYDHLGGGFARYSTDRDWLVPHFEKMLYDNSQLVSLYLEGYQATGNRDYLRIVEETLAYVQREMTSPEGGFYSTQDADSEGVEGKFYVWSEEEIQELLDPEAARLFTSFYQVSESGNWEGQNILHRKASLEEAAREWNVTPEVLQASLQQSAEILFQARSQRVWPGRDEKLIVAWNGLMLSAFAQAGRVLGKEHYLQTAIQTADFLLETLLREEGSLWHSRKDGQNRINGFVDDYACLIEGLVDLYLATLTPRYYQAALKLAETLIRKFYDAETHAWHYTPDDHEELVVRVRDRYDSAIPSGSNLAISCLLKLGVLAGREDFVQLAGECLEAVSGTVRLQPSGMGQALLAIDFFLGPVEEWVLFMESTSIETNSVDTASLPQQLLQTFRPHTLLLFPTAATDLTAGSPLLSGKSARDDKPTLYRCQRGRCQSPITGTEAILAEF